MTAPHRRRATMRNIRQNLLLDFAYNRHSGCGGYLEPHHRCPDEHSHRCRGHGRDLTVGAQQLAESHPLSVEEYPAASQAIMPPSRFQTLVYPKLTRDSAAAALMLPLRQ